MKKVYATILVFAALLTILLAPSAGATCTANITLQKSPQGCILKTFTYGSTSGCTFNDGLRPEVYESIDGGPFGFDQSCGATVCNPTYGPGCYACLEGHHTIAIMVTCGKAGPTTNGSCAVQDDPGYDTKSYDASDFDHTVTITGVEQYPVDRRNDIAVNGVIQFHVLAAGTSPGVVSTQWIGGAASGSSAVVPPAVREQVVSSISTTHSESLAVKALDTTDGNFETRFSIGIPPPAGARLFLMSVTACGNQTDSRVLSYEDNECQASGGTSCPAGCAGKPIRLSSGNMRMTDLDPLPGNDQFPMRRTYDLRGAAPGFFGYGWTTAFDARLTAFQSSGRAFLDIRTASNSEYVFQNAEGTWIQMWPKGTTPATLIPGSNTYTLREPRSVIETVFDSASGRPMRIHSRASGRDVILSYLNGVPAHASDSWGNWGWTLTADAANRIATVAVDGTSLVWTYNYGNHGTLTSVLGPFSAAWRSYTYAGPPSFNGWELKEARDARGNLIESHSYNAGTFSAISSISDQDDITSISYNLAGRDQFETVTRTTSGTGATTDYYIRSIAGRPRTVQVVGHCATCGTDDAVYAYDAATGQLLREQDARGYITVRTFNLNDQVTSVAGPFRPADCDPVSDAAHCRQTPSSLLTVDLLPTSATVTTGYAYGDANWPDIATLTSTTSALTPNQVRTTALDLDPVSGTVTRQVVTGMTGIPAQSAEYTTTTVLYDGTAGAAFNPGGAFDAAWTSLPQPAGLRQSTDGPRTDVTDTTTWVYYPIDSSVPASWRGRLAAIRNAAGHTTRFENYDVFGNAARVVDANGVATEYTFDAMGRVLTSTLKAVPGCDAAADPLCATDLVSSRTYQPALGPLATTTLPGGGATSYEYDSLGRTTATSRQVTPSAYERIEYDFDPATGHKSAERFLAGHPGSWAVTRSDAFQYDSFARLSEIDHPDGTKIVYHYDGANNISSVQDERHTSANTAYAYDPANRLAAVTQALSTAPGGQIATAYAYDIHGNLTSVTDPNGNVTTYVYDDFGRMLSQTSPVTGVTSYVYDPAGNLTSTTDANAATTTRSYDALGRVLTAISSRESDTQQVTWTYDDETAEAHGIGRLASATTDDSSATYHYDRRGLLREEVLSIEGDPFVQSYGHDADGNRSALAYPSGRIANYTFDFVGRPVAVAGSMSGSTTPYITSASYLPFGPLTSLTFGNGTAETRTFDQRYSTATIQLGTAGGLLANYTYVTDGGGNITQINDLTDSGYNRSFGYDDLNRLVTANSGASLWGTGAYTYDSMGNMLTSTLGSKMRSFTYTGATPLINTVSADGVLTPMQYDATGNELNGPAGASANFISDTRTYSPRNLLQQADLTAPTHYCRGPQSGESCTGGWVLQRTSSLWNGYDARGIRVVSMQSSSIGSFPDMKYFFYTPELTQLATFAPNDGIESDVIWFGGRPVASDTTGSPDPRFTFTDHLGTPIVQTDALANVGWRAEYEPFGNVFAMRAGGANDQRLRLPGQQVAFTNFAGDEENYNIFRWYRSGWGRYTQGDPLGLTAGSNLYRYTNDSPTNLIDALGLFVDSSTLCMEVITKTAVAPGWISTLTPLAVFFNATPTGTQADLPPLPPPPDCPKCKEKQCPPCEPPVGTIGYRWDKVPPSKPHKPYPGDHVHLYQMHQNPNNCQCFWKNLKIVVEPPPPPWAVPMPNSPVWP